MRGPESEWVPEQDPLLAPEGRQSGVPFPGKPRHFHVARTGNIGPCSLFSEMRAVDLSVKYPDALGCVGCRVEKGVL